MMKKLLLTGIGALLLVGCATDGRSPRVGVGVSVGGSAPPPVIVEASRGGPPPWAPAHGRRAKEARYRYYYYPASGVYMNVSTGGYFYLNGDTWQVAMTLPSTVRLDSGNYVSLELETDRPYLYYDEHKSKYKGYGRSKGYGHGKGHWKDKH
jgi:uncharacterized protein YcfL